MIKPPMGKTLVKTIAVIGCIFCCLHVVAQKKNSAFQLDMRKAASPISIDGNESDAAWADATPADNFRMVLPMDTSLAKVNTVVKMTYDNNNIYIVAICYYAVQGPNMVESLRRDFTFGKNDNFIFFLDPFDDQVNGFTFGAN